MLLKVHSEKKKSKTNKFKSNWTSQGTQDDAERAFVMAKVEEAFICVKEPKEEEKVGL